MKTSKIQIIYLIVISLLMTTNQGLYAGLFDQIKQLKIEDPRCLECDIKIAESEKNQKELLIPYL